MTDLTSQLHAGLTQMRLDVSLKQAAQLLSYLQLLGKWNGTYNLTAVRDEEEMLRQHVLDSLSILPFLAEGVHVADVGSGGGMPGIPVAIVRPDIQVTLIESNSKKTAFLNQAVIELKLDNVEVATGRVEAMAKRQFDVLTSRAFAELKDFVALTRTLLAPTGQWIAMKGVHPFEEINELPEGVQVTAVTRVNVPGLNAERHMVQMTARTNS